MGTEAYAPRGQGQARRGVAVTKQEQRAEKRRLEHDAHRELDKLCQMTIRLAAAETMCRNDLERATLEVLREALIERTRKIGKVLTDAGIKDPARDRLRG
jgi:hypothetical protein